MEIDHIIVRGRGGRDIPQNWQLLCRHCNGKKGTARIMPESKDFGDEERDGGEMAQKAGCISCGGAEGSAVMTVRAKFLSAHSVEVEMEDASPPATCISLHIIPMFFMCCFAMSKYSQHLEKKLDTGHKRR